MCLFFKRKKSLSFVFIIGEFLTSAILFYLIISNPCDLTHFPENAILSILIIKAITKAKEKIRAKLNDTYMYPVRRIISSDQRWYKRESWVWNRFKTLPKISNRVYFRSAAITGALGVIDEIYQGLLSLRYFAWNDILSKVIGGILGLTIFEGVNRK